MVPLPSDDGCDDDHNSDDVCCALTCVQDEDCQCADGPCVAKFDGEERNFFKWMFGRGDASLSVALERVAHVMMTLNRHNTARFQYKLFGKRICRIGFGQLVGFGRQRTDRIRTAMTEMWDRAQVPVSRHRIVAPSL